MALTPAALATIHAQRFADALSPAGRLHAARDLAAIARTCELDAIDQARSAGESWSTIGAALGISAQGAQQRSQRR